MRYDFNKVTERRDTSSLKWDKYKNSDTIPMWVADMDFCSPPEVIDALEKRLAHGIFGYTIAPDELYEAVILSLQNEFNWAVDPSWIVCLPGLVTGLNVSCRAIADDNYSVMTCSPIYPPFLSAPVNMGKRLIDVPLKHDSGIWTFDFETMEKAVSTDTKLFLLCSPHNPTGRVWSKEELVKLSEFCTKYDLLICSDEVHSSLVLDRKKQHIPTGTLSTINSDKLITLISPSKTFNLPGLGLSFAIIKNVQLRQDFIKAMNGIVPYPNALSYPAALAAYNSCANWRSSLIDYLRVNEDIVFQRINAIQGLSMEHVEATYLAWIKVEPELVGSDPATFFERKAGVGLSDGKEFGLPGYLRLNFGCPQQTLKLALDRMERVNI